ncbi:MAG: DMT family transporter [Candidatus Thorarchaeota archaeon]|nr:MAG: DMT family transporter [Candidatus Thorarchaeota archaeon]
MQLILEPYVVGVISALLAMLFFGSTNILYKKMSDDISVMDIMFTRMWVSLPIAYVFGVLATGSLTFSVPTAALFPLILSMIIGLVIGDAMYFISQERIGVSKAFPIAMSYPLLVYFLAALFLGEPVIPQRVIGAIIIVIGVIVIARAEQDEPKKGKQWSKEDIRIGIILAFLVFICWAASDVIFQFGLVGIGVAEANFYRTLAASLILVPVFLMTMRGERTLPTRRVTTYALLIGTIALGFSLIAYSFAVKFVGATLSALIISSGPMLTAPLSAIFLDEDVNRKIALGTILTILGVVLVVFIF